MVMLESHASHATSTQHAKSFVPRADNSPSMWLPCPSVTYRAGEARPQNTCTTPARTAQAHMHTHTNSTNKACTPHKTLPPALVSLWLTMFAKRGGKQPPMHLRTRSQAGPVPDTSSPRAADSGKVAAISPPELGRSAPLPPPLFSSLAGLFRCSLLHRKIGRCSFSRKALLWHTRAGRTGERAPFSGTTALLATKHGNQALPLSIQRTGRFCLRSCVCPRREKNEPCSTIRDS